MNLTHKWTTSPWMTPILDPPAPNPSTTTPANESTPGKYAKETPSSGKESRSSKIAWKWEKRNYDANVDSYLLTTTNPSKSSKKYISRKTPSTTPKPTTSAK